MRYGVLERGSSACADTRVEPARRLCGVRFGLAHVAEDLDAYGAPGYRKSRPRVKPKINEFLPVIHQILVDDRLDHLLPSDRLEPSEILSIEQRRF